MSAPDLSTPSFGFARFVKGILMKICDLPSRAALLFAVLLFCAVACPSQETQEKPDSAAPTGLALEVDPKGGRVGYHSVPGQFYGGLYRRLPSWRPPAGSLQPHTFRLTDKMEGAAVRVQVFALMDRFYGQGVLIGNFLLRLGEKAVVRKMANYGYEPMEVTVVKVKSAPSVLPTATSRVPSVEAVGVEEKQSNFPSFIVTLRNTSEKDITYLEVQTLRDGKPSGTQWPRDEQNRPLVKAGETYEVRVSGGGGLRSPDSYTPSAPQSVEVVTAVFSDKTYEGDQQSAFSFIAGLRGQKIQVGRVLALLGNASEGTNASAALERFEKQVSALDRDAPPT